VFVQDKPNDVAPKPESEHVWPGAPRIVRLLPVEVAPEPTQLKLTLGFAPKLLAVIVLLPGATESPVEAMPHVPLHE
jgi:hypothetical protein